MLFKIQLIIALICCSLIAGAQTIITHNLSIESGLSSNYIRTIYKDSQGFIWIGTDTGLERFDGSTLTSYAKRFKKPLKGAIQSLVELTENNFIVATSWGAFRYNVCKNEITAIDFGWLSVDVRAVLKARNGQVFFATDHGLFTFSQDTNKAVSINHSDKLSGLSSLAEDLQGNIWAGSNNGLCMFLRKNNDIINKKIYFAQTNVRTIQFVKNSLIVGTTQGLFLFDIQNRKKNPVIGLEKSGILSLATDNARNVYIGTDNDGVWVMNVSGNSANITRHFNSSSKNISSNTIFALLYDNSKILWVGSLESGVDYIYMQDIKRFQTFEFSGNIRSMYFDAQGNKFLGTRTGTIYATDAQNRIISTTRTGVKPRVLTTIYPHPIYPHMLLIGSFGDGIRVYNKENCQVQAFSNDPIFNTATVYKFCTDKHKNLWIATLDGVYKYNIKQQTYTKLNTTKATGSNEIFSMCYDSDDKIWFGTKNGSCYYSLSRNRFITPKACAPYQYQCTSIYIDSHKNIWFCYNKGGVLKLNQDLKELLWLSSEVGIPGNAPSSLIEDTEQNMWIGSSKGLFRVSKSGNVHAFDTEDGLNSLMFTPESAQKDALGRLWWSNDKGMVSFITDKTNSLNQETRLKLTDIYINGSRFDPDTLSFVDKLSKYKYSIQLKGKSNNNLEFRIVNLNFINPRKNQYTYMIEGIDTAWSKTSSNPIISYNNLAPGTYSLKVKATNNDERWSLIPLEVEFTISPYFYETMWFIVTLILSAIGFGLYFTRNYINSVKTRLKAQLEDIRNKQPVAKTLKIAENKTIDIKEKLTLYMHTEKAFLNPELRLADVATAIGYSVHEISYVLNSELNHNFSDFVNTYRVEEVKIRMRTEDARKFTLTAIAMQCGFSAKSSFLRAFKKATNMTPSEYFKETKTD